LKKIWDVLFGIIVWILSYALSFGFIFLLIFILIKGCEFIDSAKYKEPIVKSNSPSFDKTNQSSITAKKKTVSPYQGNKLLNGSSPFDECFGSGLYSGNAELTIKNGSYSDAIVCLFNISSRQTIRNEYIPKGLNFQMTKIPKGYYKIKVFYGNDWNPNLKNACGTNGNFESNRDFDEFDGTQYFEDSYSGYTIAEVTLYTVAGGNTTTSNINETEFFN